MQNPKDANEFVSLYSRPNNRTQLAKDLMGLRTCWKHEGAAEAYSTAAEMTKGTREQFMAMAEVEVVQDGGQPPTL